MADEEYILVVDDDQDILEAMRIILESGGHEVKTALDSRQAMEIIEQRLPRLIVLDVMMRHRDEGFQFSYKLRNDSRLAAIPILMITSVSQESGFRFSPDTDGDFLPVDAFLEKPIKPKLLLERVAELLKK